VLYNTRLYSILNNLNIEYKTTKHVAAFNIENYIQVANNIPGILTKSLFLKNKNGDLYLLTVLARRDVNIKDFCKLINISGSLRFCNDEISTRTIGICCAHISPFALINDDILNITCCIDKELILTKQYINLYPLRNDRTTSITSADLLTFLNHIHHKPIIVDFNTGIVNNL